MEGKKESQEEANWEDASQNMDLEKMEVDIKTLIAIHGEKR